MRAPGGPLPPTAVTEAFQDRARRGALPSCCQGAHCLRHSLAVHLLRQGRYRDAFLLLLRFLAARRGRDVVALDFPDLEPAAVPAFLRPSRNRAAQRGRDARLAAVHAFARYAAANHSDQLERCQRLLAVPFKRARQRVVEYLELDELRALLEAPDRTTAAGCRDYALLLVLFNLATQARLTAPGHGGTLAPVPTPFARGLVQTRGASDPGVTIAVALSFRSGADRLVCETA